VSPISEKDQKAAEKKPQAQRQREEQPRTAVTTKDSDAVRREDSASLATTSDVSNATASSDDGGLGVIVPNAARVEGEGIPVTDGGSLDLAPRNDDDKRARQELIIPENPDLYPVIKTVNDPADAEPLVDEYAEQQRIMESRRQMGFANRDEGTPVTEREQRRRMAEDV
jgi:hypothetical protein